MVRIGDLQSPDTSSNLVWVTKTICMGCSIEECAESLQERRESSVQVWTRLKVGQYGYESPYTMRVRGYIRV